MCVWRLEHSPRLSERRDLLTISAFLIFVLQVLTSPCNKVVTRSFTSASDWASSGQLTEPQPILHLSSCTQVLSASRCDRDETRRIFPGRTATANPNGGSVLQLNPSFLFQLVKQEVLQNNHITELIHANHSNNKLPNQLQPVCVGRFRRLRLSSRLAAR